MARAVQFDPGMSMTLLGIVLIGVAALLVVGGLVTRAKAKRILAAPLRKTGEAAQLVGPASFEGAIRTNSPMVGPCSGKPCVYFELVIEQKTKERKGGNTTTSWKKIGNAHVGSVFGIDDGSGAVAIVAQEKLDADLEKAFSGPPPGGQGLGALQRYVTGSAPGEVLEYRVTETMIPADGKLFALGHVQGGQVTKGNGKLMVSTRGRDALIGSTKKMAAGLFAFGGVVAVIGAVVAIVKPGEAPACGALVDAHAACVVSTTIVDHEETQPDGTKKPGKLHQQILDWEVTKAGKYELELRPVDAKEKTFVNPVVQVEDSIGLPMNVGINWGLSRESSNDYHTKTKSLSPGKYKIYAWSSAEGPDKLLLAITPLAGDTK